MGKHLRICHFVLSKLAWSISNHSHARLDLPSDFNGRSNRIAVGYYNHKKNRLTCNFVNFQYIFKFQCLFKFLRDTCLHVLCLLWHHVWIFNWSYVYDSTSKCSVIFSSQQRNCLWSDHRWIWNWYVYLQLDTVLLNQPK